MGNKRFKTELFGYSRKAVNEYIVEFDKKAKIKLEEKDEEYSSFSERITELEDENKQLKNEKEAVSRAIISAEETAGIIISKANKEAKEIIIKAEAEAKQINGEIERKTKAEIAELTEEIEKKRKNAEQELKVLKNKLREKYEKEFSDIVKLRSELNLLKAAALTIVNGNEEATAKKLKSIALANAYKPIEPTESPEFAKAVTLNEIRELL